MMDGQNFNLPYSCHQISLKPSDLKLDLSALCLSSLHKDYFYTNSLVIIRIPTSTILKAVDYKKRCEENKLLVEAYITIKYHMENRTGLK